MDGVLVDTGELHYQSWSTALEEFGLGMSREVFTRSFGMNNAGTVETLLGRPAEPELLARISDRKESMFREAARGQVQTLPGVLPWLKRFRQGQDGARFRQAVASSAPPENIELLVDEMGLREYFDALVSAFYMPGKPDPSVFLEAARLLGIPPERCVVIEDGLPGVEAARRAGMVCVAVATTNPPPALKSADLVLGSLEELEAEALLRLLKGFFQ
jgi:beta-phosphoglucomutase-like phosphatase (HAD superfamily)